MRWLLDLKSAHDRLREHDAELGRAVERKTRALRSALEETIEAQRLTDTAHLDTIRRLTIAAEYKDEQTGGHILRIGLYSEVVARRIGLSPGEVETLRHAAPMHDVGKIGTPDAVLLKPGSLNDDEWVIMRAHAPSRWADSHRIHLDGASDG
jgi:putative two-component system response regulator